MTEDLETLRLALDLGAVALALVIMVVISELTLGRGRS